MSRKYSSAIIILFVSAILFSCEGLFKGQIDQAEEYYKSGNMRLALDATKQILNKDPKNPDATVLLWKIQIRNYHSPEQVEQSYDRIRDKIMEIGEPVVPALENALADDNNFVSLFAVYALGDISGDVAQAALLNVVNGTFEGMVNKKPEEVALLQCKAAVLLAKYEVVEIYDKVVEMSKSDDAMMRAHAAEALGFLGKMEAIPILDELAKDNDTEVVTAAKNAKLYLTGGN